MASSSPSAQPQPTSTSSATNFSRVLRNAAPIRIKTVLQALIDGIRVDGRDCIEPTFRVPAVRWTLAGQD